MKAELILYEMIVFQILRSEECEILSIPVLVWKKTPYSEGPYIFGIYGYLGISGQGYLDFTQYVPASQYDVHVGYIDCRHVSFFLEMYFFNGIRNGKAKCEQGCLLIVSCLPP